MCSGKDVTILKFFEEVGTVVVLVVKLHAKVKDAVATEKRTIVM